MASVSNRQIEHYYFEMFRQDYRMPEGTVVLTDKPDVIITGKRNIGIEITNFYHKSGADRKSEQVQNKTRQRVISEAQQVYLAKGGKKIQLSFSFDPELPIRERMPLVNKIAAFAKSIETLASGAVNKEVFKYIPQISFVYIHAGEYKDPKWQIIRCLSPPLMSLEAVRAIVTSKEAKSKQYKHCEAYWLILVVDSIDPAQDQEIQIDGFSKIDSAVFEKVIVYKPYFGHVLEVR